MTLATTKVDKRTTRICDYFGSKNPNAKLDEEKVRYIKAAYSKGSRPLELAEEFGVTGSNISNIVAGRIWSHIT